MPTSSGDLLGPYEILSLLGEGGMGQVWKARDTRLDRIVAIKTSHQQFNEQFEREARAVAALNHPNVCTLHDVGPDYLVMEFVEGPTLADRMSRGAMTVEEALPIARQMAEAIEAAHEKGIIHRDLKPENVKFTLDGAVKVLDFGLAKAAEVARDPGSAPTIKASASLAGFIVGTPSYMSPEQASGNPVDKRTDIWAYGVVLWEMVTGRRMFEGQTVSHILASVLKDEPDIQAAPAQLRPLIARCLIRDPKKRLRDIGEARLMLDSDLPSPALAPAAVPPVQPPWRWMGVAGVAMLGASLLGALLYRATRPAQLRPLIRLNSEISPGAALATGTGGGSLIAFSPDGTRLALVLRGADGKIRLHTRLLNQSAATPLNGTENAGTPFFSPDGDWIGFVAGGRLKKISVEGGAAVALCDAGGTRGASWGDDGNIVLSTVTRGLSRVSSASGIPEPFTKLNAGERTHRWPQVLPGSQAVLFTAHTSAGNYDDANIDVVSVKTGERKTVQRGGYSGQYVAAPNGAGYLICQHESTIFSVPFDPRRLTATGVPVPVLDDVSGNAGRGGDFAISNAGTLVYMNGRGQESGWNISWLVSSGKTQPIPGDLGRYFVPRLSPDGKRIAFSFSKGSAWDIWVQNLDRDTPSRLTFLSGANSWPVWTPDGKSIVFQSEDPANPGVYWILADGSGRAQLMSGGKTVYRPYSFTPDGKRLALAAPDGVSNIYIAPIEGDPAHPKLGKPEAFLGTRFTGAQSHVFPGRVLAGLFIERIGDHGIIRAALPGSWRPVADFDRRRHTTRLVAGQPGIVLSNPGPPYPGCQLYRAERFLRGGQASGVVGGPAATSGIGWVELRSGAGRQAYGCDADSRGWGQ